MTVVISNKWIIFCVIWIIFARKLKQPLLPQQLWK